MSEGVLHCRYFDTAECRSCTLIETPYSTQLLEKEARCRELLPQVPEGAWLPSFSAGYLGFRNKAKLVVGGRSGQVTLGILGPDGRGVDLRECQIQAPGIAQVIPVLASFLESTALEPYDVPARRGELKFVHVTLSPSAELMLRFVVRTEHGLQTLRSRLVQLREAIPNAVVISVNLLPEHKAVLEGEREVLLAGDSLAMRFDNEERELTLHLKPRSFFQTNTEVARELYRQVTAWAVAAAPDSMWDLYCGVGGFALHCAAAFERRGMQYDVLGVELTEAAIESAARSSSEAQLSARFIAHDATAFARGSKVRDQPQLLVVNPPRRGVGTKLAEWIEDSRIERVVYSSCNPVSLAKDLAALPSYRVAEARVFDMFPHTSHLEVAVLLERVDSSMRNL